ncbi:hypothetical protein TNCV_1822751 [Trichonephila clavipes]|uniref:Uncharacterized protein n=1 Tax=Trichonephila clavipes TaxID=2585209 RepID=A0A8X6SA74_TRICX|nr:hypothetical protein TNCV_1822751 [Trichonephila clavipes]
MSSNLVPLKNRRAEGCCTLNPSRLKRPPVGVVWKLGDGKPTQLSLAGRGKEVIKASDRGWRVISSSPVPLKTRRVGKRCTLNLSRAQTSSRWCGW